MNKRCDDAALVLKVLLVFLAIQVAQNEISCQSWKGENMELVQRGTRPQESGTCDLFPAGIFLEVSSSISVYILYVQMYFIVNLD